MRPMQFHPRLGEIPRSWQVGRFGRYVEFRSGQVDPRHESFSEQILIAPNHVEAGTGRLLALESAAQQGAESGKYWCDAGDVIYSKIRPALRKVTLAPFDCLCSADMYPLKGIRGLTNRYLKWYLLSEPFSDFALQESARVAMPKLNRETLAEAAVPLPSATEQARIADFLEERTARIDALIQEKEELVTKLAAYVHSQASALMTGALHANKVNSGFPELGSIPATWTVKRLKFLGDVRSGVAKGKSLAGRKAVSLPFLRVANVQDGYVDLTEVHSIEVSESDAERYLLKKGDVLMNEGGDNDKLGRGTVWQGEIDPCIHQNHVFAVRMFEPGVSEWVARFTSTAAARTYFFLRSKQSTNLASINQTNVRELPVPMPPVEEREQVLAQVRSLSARVQELTLHAQEHIARLREYRSALISACVTGQVELEGENTLREERLAA